METSETIQKSKITTWLSPLVGLVLFCGATYFLFHQLTQNPRFNFGNISIKLASIPRWHIAVAVFLTALGHIVLTCFDFLGVHHVRQPVPYRRVAPASFVSYVLSHNIGSWSGAPYRFRAYTAAGLSPFQITTIVAWCAFTFWLGFFSLGGTLLLTISPALALVFGISPWILRMLGMVFIGIVGFYLRWSWRNERSLKIFKWYLWPPDFKLALAQIAVSVLDWMLAGTVLYFLFPHLGAVPYYKFLGVFVLTQAVAFTTQIPGGLGVFEFFLLELLSPAVPAETVLSALIAYRGIYYILPLTIGIATLGVSEILHRRQKNQVI